MEKMDMSYEEFREKVKSKFKSKKVRNWVRISYANLETIIGNEYLDIPHVQYPYLGKVYIYFSDGMYQLDRDNRNELAVSYDDDGFDKKIEKVTTETMVQMKKEYDKQRIVVDKTNELFQVLNKTEEVDLSR